MASVCGVEESELKNLECPCCNAPITSLSKAKKVSPMWAGLIRENKESLGLVGVCFDCGELISWTSFTDVEQSQKAFHWFVSSAARSRAQTIRRMGERAVRESGTPIWIGQTQEQWQQHREYQLFMAKFEAAQSLN